MAARVRTRIAGNPRPKPSTINHEPSTQTLEEVCCPARTAVHQAERPVELLDAPEAFVILGGEVRELAVDLHLRLEALYRLPDGRPVRGGVHDGRDPPVRPGRDLPFHTVHAA